mmetsp:Transcript_17761/g.50578  ORF Transcript_17761/g.50578 Transcript_17761/m.50578 type:complete len:257 (+) Transcript_17761:439-1209(+)
MSVSDIDAAMASKPAACSATNAAKGPKGLRFEHVVSKSSKDLAVGTLGLTADNTGSSGGMQEYRKAPSGVAGELLQSLATATKAGLPGLGRSTCSLSTAVATWRPTSTDESVCDVPSAPAKGALNQWLQAANSCESPIRPPDDNAAWKPPSPPFASAGGSPTARMSACLRHHAKLPSASTSSAPISPTPSRTRSTVIGVDCRAFQAASLLRPCSRAPRGFRRNLYSGWRLLPDLAWEFCVDGRAVVVPMAALERVV